MVDLLQHGGVISSFIQRRDTLNMPPWATACEVRAGSRLWYVGEMAHPIQAKDGKRKPTGTIRPSGGPRIPTTPPHPVPGGEYDRDGFLYECPVENFRHSRIGTTLVSMLVPHMRRRHGEAALVTADVGFYARREDRTRPPFVADLLVSLTAGDIDAPGTPPEEDRLSYKLWQEPLPDLVLEIVSPSSRVRDTVTKPRRYEALGIPEYWVFDPAGSAVPGGLQGRLLIDDRYADVPPRTPGPGEIPLRTGTRPTGAACSGFTCTLMARNCGCTTPKRACYAPSKTPSAPSKTPSAASKALSAASKAPSAASTTPSAASMTRRRPAPPPRPVRPPWN